jgi:hypothetical protein
MYMHIFILQKCTKHKKQNLKKTELTYNVPKIMIMCTTSISNKKCDSDSGNTWSLDKINSSNKVALQSGIGNVMNELYNCI